MNALVISGAFFYAPPSFTVKAIVYLRKVDIYNKYEPVIGLEVHVQLNTKSKLFSDESASFGGEPNSHISPFTLAHPGTLPYINEKAIEYAIKLGLTLNCSIAGKSYFARKNYFYPDLPKGYQVSQHSTPICKNGYVEIKTNNINRRILLNRIHIEEDAGKSIHDLEMDLTCIDFNRAGIPLLEVVSEPDLHSADEAFAFITELRKLVRWLGICDGNMEEGSLRCDANISIRRKGEKILGTRVEIKNLNSIRHIKKAIEFEFIRLAGLAENKETIIQETRSYNPEKNITIPLRSKENEDDYRYFPDPDLNEFTISSALLQRVKDELPILPMVLKKKYMEVIGLTEYDAAFICEDMDYVNYFESVIKLTANYKAAANWIIGPIKQYINQSQISFKEFPLSPQVIVKLIELVDENRINFGNASTKIFNALIENPASDVLQIATQLNLLQESDISSIESMVEEVIYKMPEKVKEYRSGKKGLIGLFAGEIKKISKGKADMQMVNKLLIEKLNY